MPILARDEHLAQEFSSISLQARSFAFCRPSIERLNESSVGREGELIMLQACFQYIMCVCEFIYSQPFAQEMSIKM